MHISVFGIGYVGCVNLAGLAQNGHSLIGVDVVPEKIEAINNGQWTVFEPELLNLMDGPNSLRDRLQATDDVEDLRRGGRVGAPRPSPA